MVVLVPWFPTPRARWATRCSDSWAARECPRPAFRCVPLLFYFPSSQVVCQGRREDWAISLLVCVIGVVCISFLVLV